MVGLLEGPGGHRKLQPWCCQQPSACEHRNPQSLERVTAVAAAVAAVASAGVHDNAAESQLEALNLMLPRALSATMGCREEAAATTAAAAAAAAFNKTDGGDPRAAPPGVLHGYEALRAMRARAHEFRKGYHNWRRHQAHGARGDVHDVFTQEETPYLTQQSSTNGIADWSVGGSSLESAGILMYSSKPNESSEFLSSLVCSLKTPGAAPPSAAAEALQLMHAAGRAAEQQQPQWLRFFFNPHTPLLSNGVLPLRRDFLHRISERAAVPQYPLESSAIQCWVAHVGVGGFHRSHQCVFYDELLAKTHAGLPDDLPEGVHKGPWAVCGIGILPGDKRMSNVLHEQEFLYTVLTRSQRVCEARVIGALMDFVYAPEEPLRLKGLLLDIRTKLLSLTITEKGYCMATNGDLDKSLAAVKQDLALMKCKDIRKQESCTPQTALGLIYLGLKLRRDAKIRPFTVLSCDNIPNNGKLLKKMVIQFATEVDVEMATWISKHVCFPCTMVDRITPVTGTEHIALLEEDYGIGDKWPVVAEDFKQWVIGDNFCNERPFFEAVGCLVVREVQSYEEMKLKLLNGGHSCVAYVATLLGYRFVDEALRDVRVSGFLRSFMDEVTPCLEDLKVDVERYKERIVERFGNAFVKDELQRVAQDGSSKFYSTTRNSILLLLERKKNCLKLSIALAAWILYFATDSVQGTPIVPSDPKSKELRGFALSAVAQPYRVAPVEQFLNVVYGLPADAASVLSRFVAISLASLIRRGVAETLDAGGALESLLGICFEDETFWGSLVDFCSSVSAAAAEAQQQQQQQQQEQHEEEEAKHELSLEGDSTK